MHAQRHLLPAAHQHERLRQLRFALAERGGQRGVVGRAGAESGRQASLGRVRDAAHCRLVRAQRLRGKRRRLLAAHRFQRAAPDDPQPLSPRADRLGRRSLNDGVQPDHFPVREGRSLSAAQSSALSRR